MYSKKQKPIKFDVGYHSSVYKKPTKGLPSRGFHAQGHNQFRTGGDRQAAPGLGLRYKKQPIFMFNLLSTKQEQSPSSSKKQVLRENQHASAVLESRLKKFELEDDKTSRSSKAADTSFQRL
ncbi:MAG: hypothetical protein CMM87_02880 [Rickettsiales bacterium]|nr:hypothetical protein [Rickettsiales bacterium]